jgi:vitamin B12 transporter
MNLFISRSSKKFFFRRFLRKKYAVFNSMCRVVHISSLLAVYSLILNPQKLSAQTDTSFSSKIVELGEVEITGQKGPAILTELPRLVTIISTSETESAPSHSLPDLINYTANIDIRQRGKNGIQSDVSIRGSSFDHNLILLNGINISDPQSGHLSLFLPIESESVKQIEILSGPAARLYGANAFAGAINFITNPGSKNSFTIGTSGGQFDYNTTSANLEISLGKVRQGIYIQNGSSSGYMLNTDYRKHSFFYQGVISNEESMLDFQLGFADRAFGANSFYTPRYPDQFEENKLSFISVSYKSGNTFKIHPRIYWRRNRDRFELFRENENWYRIDDSITISNNITNTQYDTVLWYSGHNHHTSDIFGTQFTLSTKTKLGESTIGWHLRSENILSTNIGYDKGVVIPVRGYDNTFYSKSDNRTNFDTYLEQTFDYSRIYISAGLLLNWNSYLPNKINLFPGIDFRIFVSRLLSFYGSYNYTLGMPTFTDLSYEDPTNEGNNTLQPYSQHSIEGGMRLMSNSTNFTIAGFNNFGKGVIDWVWFSDIQKFKPVNIDSYSGRGIEFTGTHHITKKATLAHFIRSVRLNYTFIDMHKEVPGNISKYFNIRQKFSAMLQHEIVKNLIIAENISFVQREGNYLTYNIAEAEYVIHAFQPYWMMDLRISYTFSSFTLFAEATNLFDKKYIDIGSNFQPGRWISAGFRFNITGF